MPTSSGSVSQTELFNNLSPGEGATSTPEFTTSEMEMLTSILPNRAVEQESESGAGAAPPAPLSVEEEEDLITKRKEVKLMIAVLMQIGFKTRARNEREILQLYQYIGIDSEMDATFLEELLEHLSGLRKPEGHGDGGPPPSLSPRFDELLRWVYEKRGEGRAPK